MKSLIIAFLAGALALVTAGCAQLKDKSVAVDAGGIGVKATTAADAATGTPMPTVAIGQFGGAFVDHAKEDGDLVYYREEKSLWGSEISSRTFIMMKAGAAKSMEIKPDQAVSLPGLSVIAGSSTIKITAESSKDSSSSNESQK